MAFTYTLPFASDRDRARFHLGDTDANAPRFQDEEIDAAIAESDGDWKRAVILLIRNLIARLTAPDFTADWLTVSMGSARAAWQQMLKEKQREFGIGGSVSTGAVNVYRADSDQIGTPVYGRYPDGT